MKRLHNGKAFLVGAERVSFDYHEPHDVWINIDQCPNLKVIGCNMTSVEHLPLAECERRGIKVISLAPPRNKETEEFLSTISSTAEHTIGLMIALMRNYKSAFDMPFKNREEYRGHTLRGKTLGIIGGHGRIGFQLAKIAEAMGMVVNIYEKDSPETILWVLLKNSDVVSINIPLAGNEGFFTKEMFKQMKPTASFINTSRSGVIEKGALLWALENKVIHSAAVDFIDDEALLVYNSQHDNLLLTNHLGGCTFEDMQKTEDFIMQKIDTYLQTNV